MRLLVRFGYHSILRTPASSYTLLPPTKQVEDRVLTCASEQTQSRGPSALCPLHPRKRTYAVQKASLLWAISGHQLVGASGTCAKGRLQTFLPCSFIIRADNYAARSTRISISLRRAPKSTGLVKSPSAPPSNTLRLVSTSP